MEPVEFEVWVEEQKRQLASFERYWKANNQLDPKNFPYKLFLGDWDEQFILFQPVYYKSPKQELS